MVSLRTYHSLLLLAWILFLGAVNPLQVAAKESDSYLDVPRQLDVEDSKSNEVYLEVHLSERRVTVYRGDHAFKSYEIAIGRTGWETPVGEFSITQIVQKPVWQNPLTGEILPAGHAFNPLGDYWVGFSIQGRLWYGLHDTNEPDSIGKAISHGCIRLRKKDMKELFSLVRQGTIITIFK